MRWRGRSVLIVDDDPGLRAIVGEVLEAEGYQTTVASNGAEALRIVDRSVPDLILLELRLPVLDGWAFAAELQRRRIDCPILAMTVRDSARRGAEQIRAAGCLAKPFTIDELVDAVERLCVAGPRGWLRGRAGFMVLSGAADEDTPEPRIP